VDRGFYTNIKGPQLEGDIEVDFSDIRKLQILIDKLERLLQVVNLNIGTSLQMKGAFGCIKSCSATSMLADFDHLQSQIDSFTAQHRMHGSRLQSLINRGKEIRVYV
jgi:hypothetical protein